MHKLGYFFVLLVLVIIPLITYSQEPVSDLNVDVKYPKVLYLNSPEQIEVTVKNVGPLPTSEITVKFDVPLGGPMILPREKSGPEILKPGDSMKFVFDVIGKNTGEYRPKIIWDWKESEHMARGKQDTLPSSISVQEQPPSFNLGWALIFASAGGGAAYVIYHMRRKMRQMEQETDT